MDKIIYSYLIYWAWCSPVKCKADYYGQLQMFSVVDTWNVPLWDGCCCGIVQVTAALISRLLSPGQLWTDQQSTITAQQWISVILSLLLHRQVALTSRKNYCLLSGFPRKIWNRARSEALDCVFQFWRVYSAFLVNLSLFTFLSVLSQTTNTLYNRQCYLENQEVELGGVAAVVVVDSRRCIGH